MLAHSLIVSSWPSWPSWASQSVYMEKRWISEDGDPIPSQKGEPVARRGTLLAKPLFFTFTRFATFFNPLNHKIKNLNSHLLSIFISYRSGGEKLIKYQANSFCVIMVVILLTTLFYNALIFQGEIWCWSFLGLKGLRERMKSWLTQGSSGRGRINPSTRDNFSPYKWT